MEVIFYDSVNTSELYYIYNYDTFGMIVFNKVLIFIARLHPVNPVLANFRFHIT